MRVQVLKGKFTLCGTVAQTAKSFSKRSAFYALGGLVDKIGDIKVSRKKDQFHHSVNGCVLLKVERGAIVNSRRFIDFVPALLMKDFVSCRYCPL